MSELTQEVEISSRENVASQTQPLWAYLLIEELIRQGVGLFVLAPGSRSSPLALAVAESPNAPHLIHFDERGGAFAALGFARATGRPAAWITTSGTAVANGLPAAIEADAESVPLILITADRPPELRETAANQTIRQPGLFGSYVRWQFDMPVPDPAIDPAFVLTTAAQAAHRSLSPSGPVHLNCMYREPLTSTGDEMVQIPAGLLDWQSSTDPYTRNPVSQPLLAKEEIEVLARRLGEVERGLVVLGKSDDPQTAASGAMLADALGWPILADVASGGRLGSKRGFPYEPLLASERFCQAHEAEAVLQLGGKITSKRLQRYIQQTRLKDYIVVHPNASRYDPLHCVTDRIQSDLARFCEHLTAFVGSRRSGSSWQQVWETASSLAEGAVDSFLEKEELCEPAIARTISRTTPAGHGLILASSMPIRDMDAFAVRDGPHLRVTANRGASGIDGTVATAAGFARGLNEPSTLFIGDLALLHDLNSLALLATGLPVTVVIVNNDGGGIFSFLPIAERNDVFEAFFGTPHGLGFKHAAEMFGLSYIRPKNINEFEAAYKNAMSGTDSSVIEVRTNRDANAALHRELFDAVVDAVDASAGI